MGEGEREDERTCRCKNPSNRGYRAIEVIDIRKTEATCNRVEDLSFENRWRSRIAVNVGDR
jgi:hypothetical protein